MKLASLLILLACAAWPQLIRRGSASNGKVTMSYETRLEPGSTGASSAGIGGGVIIGDASPFAYRYLVDPSQRKYFGYEASFELVPGTKEIRFVMRALTLRPDRLSLKDPETWSPLPLPKYPPPQTLHDGDKLQFDLMANPNTGQRIVEHLEFHLNDKPPGPVPAASPRDFRTEEVTFELVSMVLTINGKPVDGTPGSGPSVLGSPLWMYLPKRGRYIFSLAPRLDLGFQRAGEISGTEMLFRVAGEELRIKSTRNIVPGDGHYHLYVHHDPSYRPKGEDWFTMGVGGTLESLIRR